MSKKKVTGADGKTYTVKEKKPFYKKIWFWVVVVIIVLGAGGMAGGSDDKADTADSSSSSAKTESAKTVAKKAPAKQSASKITQANFDKIAVSDSDGWTQDQVKKLFGKDADSSSTQTIQDVKADDLIWNGVSGGSFASAITIGFSNNHVVSKGIAGLKVKRDKKLTLADFNKIQNGMTKDQVKEIVGDPNDYSTSSIMGQTDDMWEYSSNISGDVGANFNVTFTNGTVSGQSQSSMK